jgi:CheY-like chemotaxis protein
LPKVATVLKIEIRRWHQFATYSQKVIAMNSETVGRPMEILLVEDSLTDARLAIEALRTGDIKHRLTLVRDGQEAMDFLERRHMFARAPRPDLILLDLQLPKCDGRDVLTFVRDHRDLKQIPVVILTSSKAHEDIVRSELLQVDGFLTKPVDVEQFITLVRQLKHFWHADVILPQSVSF